MIPKHILPVALELMKFRLPTVQTSIIDANRRITKNGLKLYNQDKKVLIEYLKHNHSESSITESSNVCTVCYHIYDYIEKNYFQENEPLKESVVITNQEEDSGSVFINLEDSVKTQEKMNVPISVQVEKEKDDEE
jgi:hypothetical protein